MVVATEKTPNAELVLAHLDSLPTLPAVAVQFLELSARDSASVADVIQLLRGDQSLTAKILSVAQSSAVAARHPVTTLDRAIPLIGIAGVRSIVLASAVFDSFRRNAPSRAESFDRSEFWKHSIAVACAARRLAKALPNLKIDAEEAFVGGLLHDLGKVALDAVFPKAYERVMAQAIATRGDIADAERSVLGVDHTVAGRRLAERWRLPRQFQEVIWLHHLSAETLPRSVTRAALIGLVQIADVLARELHVGLSGNFVFYESSAELAERLGLTAAIEEVGPTLLNDVSEQCRILGIERPVPEAMYAQSMARANAELSRVNNDLLTGNRRLAAGARYFKAIAEFDDALRDWADPSAVVVAIARSAAAALQRPHMAALGFRASANLVDFTWWTTSELPASPTITQPAPAELLSVLETLRDTSDVVAPAPTALRELVAGALDGLGEMWFLPISHGGELVGGLVYPSESDERNRLSAERDELRSYLTSLALALSRAGAYAAARKLSEDLAETNRRLQQAQAELLRSRTLSMIAEMAAGAGHELNGPLTVISGRAQLLAGRVTDPDAQRALQLIAAKAHECSGIVTELMDFARPRTPKLAPLDLLTLVEEVRADYVDRGALLASRISVERPLGETLAVALADREQIRIVLTELLDNAADAISQNEGRVSIALRPSAQERGIDLVVRDTGCGMTPNVLQRAFDPFFSHRVAGRGRGLGLARAYRIIEAHGGRIWLESRRDEGTLARVFLPAG